MLTTFRCLIAALACFAAITASADRVPMYRSYSFYYNDYLLTTNQSEHFTAINSYGYADDGIAFWVDDINSHGTVPFGRYFIGWPQWDHFYTASPSDAAYVLSNGWVSEGNAGYIYPDANSPGANNDGAVPIYRMHYHNWSTGDLAHYYSRHWSDVAYFQSYGWEYDGIAGYAHASATPSGGYRSAILTYHSGQNDQQCNYANNHIALATDLQTLRQQNFKIVSLRTISQWATGQIPSGIMPARFVAITVDDGSAKDVTYAGASNPCGNRPFYQILKDEWLADRSLPPSRWLFAEPAGPLATAFVVASPTIRSPGNSLSHLGDDSWWAGVNNETNPKVLDIQNHSTDHEGHVGSGPMYEYSGPFGGIPLNIGGALDGNYGSPGSLMFCRIGAGSTGVLTADREVRLAAQYISAKLGGVWPDMFAVPVGAMSVGLRNYLSDPSYKPQHQTTYAYLGDNHHVMAGGSHPYGISRFVMNSDWSSTNQLLQILFNYVDPSNPRTTHHTACPPGY